jgi:cytochrome c oxidase subunit 3
VKAVRDLSGLPRYGFGPATTTWWGTLGFMTLEGFGFLLAAGAYLYLMALAPKWPLNASQPDYWPGTIVALLLLASLPLNHLVWRWAEAEKRKHVCWGLVGMSILGILPMVVRWFEFGALNVRWDSNAYGSAAWFLLGLHTAHILTDLGDTLVLTVMMFTRHGQNGRRFSDVSDNAFYWDFVVLTWLPIYALLYWVPRLA